MTDQLRPFRKMLKYEKKLRFAAGDKLIEYSNAAQSPIRVRTNKRYFLKWALIFLGLAIYLMFFFGERIERFSIAALGVSALLGFPFLGVAVAYFIRSRKSSGWEFNVARKELISPKGRPVSFEKIRRLQLTRLPDGSYQSERESLQVDLVMINGYELTLISSDDHDAAMKAAELIAARTGIPLDREPRFA